MNNALLITSMLALVVIGIGTFEHTHIKTAESAHAECTSLAMPHVTAKAAYAYDVSTGRVLFEKNADAQLPLASLTKVMTALIASQSLGRNATVSITERALQPEGDSGLFAGEEWSSGELSDFTLITSSNDGARALALVAANGSLEAFIEKMNAEARSARLTQTYFLNETGLDISTSTAGAYGSARDVAELLAYGAEAYPGVLDGSAQRASVYTSLSGFVHDAEHTSTIPGSLPGELIVKTGFTDLAGGNLAALVEILPGKPVAIAVLGSTREARESDTVALMHAAKVEMKRATLCNNYDY